MIVAFAGQKGGVGKTTCVVSAAVEWHARGKRVLIVDTDPQASACTWAAVAAEAGVAAPTVVSMGRGLHRPDQLPALAALYDITVVDCPPRLDDVQRAVLMVADVAVFPCGPGSYDAWALAEVVSVVDTARLHRPELLAVTLVTRKQKGTLLGREVRGTLAGIALPTLDTELSYSVVYPESAGVGMGPTTHKPKSDTAAEVRRLCTELERMFDGRAR